MRSALRRLTAASLVVAVPLVMIACGDSEEDKPSGSGGAGTGGKGGTGGGTGGSATGGAGATTTGGAGGATTGGAGGSTGGTGGGTGGTGGGTGGSGGTGGTPACDLSGTGKTKQDIPNPTGTMTLTADKVWNLKDTTYVDNGQVLTIEPCTRIEGAKTPLGTLVVTRGGKIMAQGTADEPILFTSAAAAGSRAVGDWGGIVLLGRATNFKGTAVAFEGLAVDARWQYGGTDDADNSGTMKYARIEYAGFEIATDKEVNGLSFASVGSGTVIDHIMVNNAADDCFEWFGGTVSANHLICNNADDDMFDTDEGYRGTLDTLFGRNGVPASEQGNGFEMDSDLANATPVTNVTVKNVTLCGSGAGVTAQVAYGGLLRENWTGSFDNIVLTGFDFGFDVRDPFGTTGTPNAPITNSLLFAMPVVNPADAADVFDEQAWWDGGTGNSTTAPSWTDADCIAAGGPAASVTGSNKGAFTGDGAWIQGLWVNWDEQ